MGLFVNKIVCASNENSVLTDFFNTLTYNKNREFIQTNSPSMDILISSNLERLLYLVSNYDNDLVSEMMKSLKETGIFKLPLEFKQRLEDFLVYSIDKQKTVELFFSSYNSFELVRISVFSDFIFIILQ